MEGLASRSSSTSTGQAVLQTTHEALEILREYENDEIPTVIIAVAGRSNGLGPVPSVASCNMTLDIWSSVRMPLVIGCSFGAEEAALRTAKHLASNDYMIFGKIL
ncbi:hypothetical protein KIN20_018232 [Parelaphostrongylus tenuis]|uniref:Phosphoribosylaminoimidazole carboxylase n=1 Tax=Parelaphostrongylus tenuis TaxID=148309 RepID=A0AAD5N407_PARTN|nr:hypothetical protein KIN20_018232 [Parelaphostrongylus tenuis]